MKYQHYTKDAEVARAKAMVRECLSDAVGRGTGSSDVDGLAEHVLRAFDKINSRKREATARRNATSRTHPPLKVYPRPATDTQLSRGTKAVGLEPAGAHTRRAAALSSLRGALLCEAKRVKVSGAWIVLRPHRSSPNQRPAFWRCVKSCVKLGLIYVLWLPLPSAYGVYLPSALSRPAGARGTYGSLELC